MSSVVNDTDFLVHFGIFGQKWGVRRYQNEDGTLTEEGKKRYKSRSEDIEDAKSYAKAKIASSKESEEFYTNEAKKIRSIPANKKSIMNFYKISDDDYDLYLEEYGSPKKIIQNEAKIFDRHAELDRQRIRDWHEKIYKLDKIKVSAITPDREHMSQIDNVFTDAKGFAFRSIELGPLHTSMKRSRTVRSEEDKYTDKDLAESRKTASKVISDYRKLHPNSTLSDEDIILNRYGYVPKSMKNVKSAEKKLTLTQRFNNALKDNPKLTYNQIYKEMKVNMNSEDQDDYKRAEAAWFKKHGY